MSNERVRRLAEEWKPIVGFEGYDVSSHGRVRSWRHKNGKRSKPHLLSLITKKLGHKQAQLYRNGIGTNKSVHVLVIEHFGPPKPSPTHIACHNNGDARDNYFENIRWDTMKGNMSDKYKHGTAQVGERANNAKLKNEQVAEIRLKYGKAYKPPLKKIAAQYQVGVGVIQRVLRGESYKEQYIYG